MARKKSKLISQAFVACTVLAFICGCNNSPNSQNGNQLEQTETASVTQSNSSEQTENISEKSSSERYGEIENKGNWNYQAQTDPMTDKVSHIAHCVSSEKQSICDIRTLLHLGLLNDGNNNYVMLSVQGGVLRQDKLPMAHVRFDSGDVEMWSVMADGARTHHIVKSDEFINRLKQSNKCAIKIEAQDGGTATFTFNTEGLEWNY